VPLHVSGRHRARHAAPGPASTPLTGLVEAVAARAGGVARRSAVVAASTGLVMTMGVTASSAAPLVEEPRPQPALTAPAERAEVAEPAVTEALTVAADVPVTFTRSAAPGVIAPPPPPPPPAPVVEEAPADADDATDETATSEREDVETVSRSSERGSASEDSDEEASEEETSDEEVAEDSSQESAPEEEPAPEAVSDDSSSEDASGESSEESSTGDSGGSAPSSAGSSVLDIAAQYVGTPYSYGGTSPSGFDCSGFTQYVFAQAGISLPRTAASQGAGGTRVSRSEARPGDLAVVSDGSHVGIYAGDNQWYDSPRPGKSVSLRAIWTSDVYFVRY